MSQVKPLKLLANGEISYIDSANDELTMKSVTAEVVNITSSVIGEKLSLKAVLGDDIVLNVRDENDVSVVSIDKDGNMIVQDLTVNGAETVIGNMIAESELTVQGDFTVEGNTYLGNDPGDLINFVGTADTALKMGGNTITSLGAPSASGDAATKAYVDDSLGALDDSAYLRHDGSVGMSADFNSNGFKIIGLANGTVSTDAINLGQLNSTVAPYLTSAIAASTYETIANVDLISDRVTSIEADYATSGYVTDSIAALNVSQYIDSAELSSALSPYLTSATAATTYETIANVDLISDRVTSIEADYATSGYVTDSINAAVGGIDFSDYLKHDGSVPMSANFDAGSFQIKNLANGTLSTDATNLGQLTSAISAIDYSAFTKHDGSVAFSGNQSMGGFKLTSLLTPSASGDAANKAYVDSEITSLNVSQYIDSAELSSALSPYLTSATAATTYETIANVDLISDRVTSIEADYATSGYVADSIAALNIAQYATIAYVDITFANKLDLAGGTMLGAIDMGDFKITSLASPTASGDAANKAYVDDSIDAAVGGIDFSDFIKKDGSVTMENALNMGSFQIHNVSNGSTTFDAVNLGQLEQAITDLNVSQYIDSAELTSALAPYLTSADAVTTYETISNAAATYETISNAAATYLTISNAATTYETIANVDLISDRVTSIEADYATSGYVTDSIAALNVSQYIDSAELSSALSPYLTSATAAATYQTIANVTSGLALKLNLSGGTMSGAIDMGGFAITSLLTPSASGDAANKAYVDSSIAAATSSEDVALSFTASGSISAGSPVFVVSSANDTVAPGDASSVGTSRLIGISEVAITDAALGKITISGFATIPGGQIDGGSFTVGSPVYLSENAGKLTSTAPSTPGSRVYQVGVATASTKLVIDLKQGITVT